MSEQGWGGGVRERDEGLGGGKGRVGKKAAEEGGGG